MNLFMVSGRLTKEPWVSDSEKVLKMSIAVDRKMNKEKMQQAKLNGDPTADFFEITVFQPYLIDWVKNLKKGDKVTCLCRLQNGKKTQSVNKEGIPVIYQTEEKILIDLEVTSSKPHESHTEVVLPKVEHEDDPIVEEFVVKDDDYNDW